MIYDRRRLNFYKNMQNEQERQEEKSTTEKQEKSYLSRHSFIHLLSINVDQCLSSYGKAKRN